MAHLIGYCRVSTDDQALHGISIAAQGQEILRWVEANGHTLVALETDDGVSGGQRIELRPGGARVISMLADGKANGIVAVSQDRIYRDDAGWAILIDAMTEAGAGIYLTNRGTSSVTATSHDRMVAGFMSVIATGHRLAIKEHTTRALRNLRDQGKRWSKNVPITARLVGGRVVDDPRMVEAAQIAGRLHDEKQSLRAIARELVLQGFPNPRSKDGTWHPDSVNALLAQRNGWRETTPGYTGATDHAPRRGGKSKRSALQGLKAASTHRLPKKRKASSK